MATCAFRGFSGQVETERRAPLFVPFYYELDKEKCRGEARLRTSRAPQPTVENMVLWVVEPSTNAEPITRSSRIYTCYRRDLLLKPNHRLLTEKRDLKHLLIIFFSLSLYDFQIIGMEETD